MNTNSPTPAHIIPAIEKRFSARSFSPEPISNDSWALMFEAARWAPSAFNAQPWHFVVADKTDSDFYNQVLTCIKGDNAQWAAYAPALMVTVAKLFWEVNGMPNPWAWHDLGMATQNLALQAQQLGISLCEIGSIDEDRLRQILSLPNGYQPVTIAAVGYWAAPDYLPEKLAAKASENRVRKPIEKVFSINANPQLEPLDPTKTDNYNRLKSTIHFDTLTHFFNSL